MKQRQLKAITLQGVIEKSNIEKIINFKRTKMISYFGATNNIFVEIKLLHYVIELF